MKRTPLPFQKNAPPPPAALHRRLTTLARATGRSLTGTTIALVITAGLATRFTAPVARSSDFALGAVLAAESTYTPTPTATETIYTPTPTQSPTVTFSPSPSPSPTLPPTASPTASPVTPSARECIDFLVARPGAPAIGDQNSDSFLDAGDLLRIRSH